MRYSYDFNAGVFCAIYTLSNVSNFGDVVYDDIVDRSHFVLDSESVRDSILSTSSGVAGKNLKYDTDGMPTDFEIALRQGKLDKAEVYQYQLKLQDDIDKGIKSKSEVKKQVDKISNDTDNVLPAN